MTVIHPQLDLPLLSPESNLQQIVDALANRVFENRPSGFALVVGEEGRLVGVVTDADLRKYVANWGKLPLSAESVMNREFVWAGHGLTQPEIAKVVGTQITSKGWGTDFPVRFVPLLDSNFVPKSVIDLMDLEIELKKLRDKIVVVGLGYVGLTVALALAKEGIQVAALDVSEEKIQMLKSGISPIFEPDINDLIKSLVGNGLDFFSKLNDLPSKISTPTTYLLCLPTPLDPETMSLSSRILDEFVANLIPTLRQGDSIVMRSTVPIGTGDKMIRQIESQRNWVVGSDFYYAHAPERTVEGNALREIHDLPQIVGGATPYCTSRLSEFFERICTVIVPVSSVISAEMVKVAGNGFRDHIFAFSNQLAEIAREFNIDVNEVIEKSNLGYNRSFIPYPSPGVGGPCLSKDSYLLKSKKTATSPAEASRIYNEGVPEQVVEYVLRHTAESKNLSAIVIGLAFKGEPPTNDLRESSNIIIADLLDSHFKDLARVDAVVDPSLLKKGISVDDLQQECDFDFIGILNNHHENPKILYKLLANRAKNQKLHIFDPWRMIDPNYVKGFDTVNSLVYLTMSTVRKF